ncbi:YybH family protein [Cognatazoarcus halotolerans]|uniref:YybH family protein n=1 Tax=Cognatazoarcus halotolerans TaxID=2686016 RepID=UPI00135C4A8F|nr:nuclear transport factor 2 family protein [Cognatazoarcus halotolerans]MBX3678701.1 nuclear transport factor 2 family protein [Rhodocyclaceae bacterium]MCB1899480.1 nuclear transport factor 2 family protein [Rhodocyclaceae bacterium]MCP5309418.1 nuclear transport factor 2 family protein [Zoogloeaceae bacterium]
MSTPFFSSAEEVETAFYDALARADLDAMMAVWSEDDEPVCIHPGGPRLHGMPAIRDAWQQLFAGGPRLRIKLSELLVQESPMFIVRSLIEEISMEGISSHRPTPVLATNIYIRGPQGWRMVLHHASPLPAEEHPTHDEARHTLH